MKRRWTVGGLIVAVQILGGAGAVAGPWEDGMAAYNRGDYVPAIQVFRAMALQGNAKAQAALGVMYRRGKGSRAIRRAPSSGSAAPRRRAMPRPRPSCTRSRRP